MDTFEEIFHKVGSSGIASAASEWNTLYIAIYFVGHASPPSDRRFVWSSFQWTFQARYTNAAGTFLRGSRTESLEIDNLEKLNDKLHLRDWRLPRNHRMNHSIGRNGLMMWNFTLSPIFFLPGYDVVSDPYPRSNEISMRKSIRCLTMFNTAIMSRRIDSKKRDFQDK